MNKLYIEPLDLLVRDCRSLESTLENRLKHINSVIRTINKLDYNKKDIFTLEEYKRKRKEVDLLLSKVKVLLNKPKNSSVIEIEEMISTHSQLVNSYLKFN